MFGYHQSGTLASQGGVNLAEFINSLRGKITCGLVEKVEIRLAHHGAAAGDSLFLSTRNVKRFLPQEMGDVDLVDHTHHAVFNILRVHPVVFAGEGQLAGDIGGEELGAGILKDRRGKTAGLKEFLVANDVLVTVSGGVYNLTSEGPLVILGDETVEEADDGAFAEPRAAANEH